MAFSMFLRSSVCANQMISRQIPRLLTQPALSNSTLARLVGATRSVALKETKSTPILNSVRSFRTSLVRLAEEKPHDHAKLWVVERLVAAVLIPLIPIGLLAPNKLCDYLIAILISAHSFWGLEAIAVDYVRASIFGPVVPKLAIGLVYLITMATLGGLFYVIAHDTGIWSTIRQFWAIKTDTKKA